MLSLLSSRYNSLCLTQITNAYIVLNTSCKKLDYKFAECVIVMLSLGYHLRQSQKRAFLFSVKRFCRFQGVQPAPMGAEACPFLGHPCFQNKCFAVFRGCNRRQWGGGMSLFGAFLFSGKSFCQNRDIKRPQNGPNRPKTAQNGPNRPNQAQNGPKTACACPFFGHSCFWKKTFVKIRTCNIMCVFHNMSMCINT